ncbi:response regulator transcription factor [Streptomyces sp. NBC_01485]|uniref:response regulator transcription factor n=1 Tax=Streptomyces sp. NBC_01485 TaxID=2903884 RepID=UPI002E335593|nr:response regulator transcription factor [Streptomyces sp. NBC_01485]
MGGQQAAGQPRGRHVRADAATTLLLAAEPAARGRLRAALDGVGGFRTVGEADDGHGLLRLARERRPGLVLMDAALPGPDALEVVHRLARESSRPCGVVLIVSGAVTEGSWVLGAARAGVRGFLREGQCPQEVLSAVREVAAGGITVGPDIVGQMLDALRDSHRPAPRQPHAGLSLLTPRERQVFRLVARGLTNQQISDALVLSEGTVKSYFNRVCHKLDLRNRVDAVILAYESGIAGAMLENHPAGEFAVPA